MDTTQTDCGVSVDRLWQKRDFVSVYSCVAALSIDTGKLLDVKPYQGTVKGAKFTVKCTKPQRNTKSFAKATSTQGQL